MQYYLSALDILTRWLFYPPFRLGTWFYSLTGYNTHFSGQASNCQDKVQVAIRE